MKEWAFTSAENTDKEQAILWFATTSTEHHLARLTQIFTHKFRNTKVSTDIVEPFIFHPAFVVCQFGWDLLKNNSKGDYYNDMRTIWKKLTSRVGKPKLEIHVLNTIQSGSAAELFIKYYTDYEYYLSNKDLFPHQAYVFILDRGNEAFKTFLFQKLLKWFKEKPWNGCPC